MEGIGDVGGERTGEEMGTLEGERAVEDKEMVGENVAVGCWLEAVDPTALVSEDWLDAMELKG